MSDRLKLGAWLSATLETSEWAVEPDDGYAGSVWYYHNKAPAMYVELTATNHIRLGIHSPFETKQELNELIEFLQGVQAANQ